MLRIIATALFALFVTPSYAQQAIPIDTCGTLSDNVTAGGPAHVLYMDKFGTLCVGSLSWNGSAWVKATGLTTGTVGVPSAAVVTTQLPASGGDYPTAASPIAGNASGTTGSVVGTLAGTTGKTTYICDFDVSALGTANSSGPVVVAGLLGGSKTYQMSTLATGVAQNLTKSFKPCIPASAANTSITVTTTAAAGGTAVNVNSSGYQQ